MIIYNYNNSTGEYLDQSEANLDPLETEKQGKNIYLMPASSTSKKPPLTTNNEIAIFNISTDKWSKKPDYRNEIYYDISTKEKVIFNIGGAPNDSMTLLIPFNNCKWDGLGWIIDEAIVMQQIRVTRNGLLNEADKIYCNAELWESMTQEIKDEWKMYKQLLRDLPTMIDVNNPVYPIKPTDA